MPLHHISFRMEQCTESNDHQVRILIDGEDIISKLDETMFGIDPPELFASQALTSAGALIFARCSCGVVGCGDGTVDVVRNQSEVTWRKFCPKIPSINSLSFSRQHYDTAVQVATCNFDWETVERTAERLIAALDFDPLRKYGLVFVWASGRLNKQSISVSFNWESQYQVIMSTPWDHGRPESAVEAIRAELVKHPYRWSEVRYTAPVKDMLGSQLCGPGWQRV